MSTTYTDEEWAAERWEALNGRPSAGYIARLSEINREARVKSADELSDLLADARADWFARNTYKENYTPARAEGTLSVWAGKFLPSDVARRMFHGGGLWVTMSTIAPRVGTIDEVEEILELHRNLSLAEATEIHFEKIFWVPGGCAARIEFKLSDPKKVALTVSGDGRTTVTHEGTFAEMWNFALGFTL